MSFLEQAKKPQPKPPLLTIVGTPGTGKTTLGALFPSPVFIQAEDAETVFENWDDDVQPTLLSPIPKPTGDGAGNLKSSARDTLMAQMRELATADHGFKTLVVDAVTSLNTKFESELALRDGVDSVADAAGGFHKGYDVVAQWHSDFLYACEVLRARKGMAVVLLAHAGIEKVKNRPDEASEYTVYSIDMYRKSAQRYISNSDAVIYITKEEFIQGAETNRKGQTTKFGRVMQTGERVLITSGDGKVGYVAAKNRYNMPVEIPAPLGENPLLQYIKHFNKNEG